MEAIADPPAYHRARAAVRYDDVARTLVHALKYGDRLDLAPTMGRWMANAGRELLADADALVPVPLHWRRQWARRFNQSALLAEVIAKASGRAGRPRRRSSASRRRRSRSGSRKSERAQNVQGAFRVPADGKAEVAGRKLVLVDDVLTSGATVGRLRAGAAAGAAPPPSTCWYSPGLWRRAALPYKHVGKVPRVHMIQSRNLHHPLLPLLPSPPSGCCRARGSTFTEIDVSGDPNGRSEMVARANGRMTVPQIFIGATHVGGCDDLYALDQAGKLDPLLGRGDALASAGNEDRRHEHRQGCRPSPPVWCRCARGFRRRPISTPR